VIPGSVDADVALDAAAPSATTSAAAKSTTFLMLTPSRDDAMDGERTPAAGDLPLAQTPAVGGG